MSSSTSGGEDAADDDVVFSDAKEEVDQSETEVGPSLSGHIMKLSCARMNEWLMNNSELAYGSFAGWCQRRRSNAR